MLNLSQTLYKLIVNDEMQLPPTECGLGRFVQVQITKNLATTC